MEAATVTGRRFASASGTVRELPSREPALLLGGVIAD